MNLLQCFQDKRCWLPTCNEHVIAGDVFPDSSSRIEPEHGLEMFTNAVNPDLLPCKKQAVESSITTPESGVISDALSLENSSVFQSELNQHMDRLVGSETTSANLTERNMSDVGMYGSHVKKQGADEQLENDLYVDSSILNGMEDQGFNNHGIRKLDVEEVKDSENGLQTSVEHDAVTSMDIADVRGSENSTFISMEQPYGKEVGNVTLNGHSLDTEDVNISSTGSTIGKDIIINGTVKTTPSISKKDTTIYQKVMKALKRPVSSYSLLYEEQHSVLIISKKPRRKKVHAPNGKAVVKRFQAPKHMPEKKAVKKEAPNKFPSNVKSLTMTGMLDELPVRYISASKEKELRGIIKGYSYLCGCSNCDYSKALNAYEFERHAGCKTNHPNNHIHFENGKTIYQIVQELQSTPESMLFDSIQTLTGTSVDQKAFHRWKESATSKLRRVSFKE